jgi:hypothetical protein
MTPPPCVTAFAALHSATIDEWWIGELGGTVAELTLIRGGTITARFDDSGQLYAGSVGDWEIDAVHAPILRSPTRLAAYMAAIEGLAA